MLMCPGLPHYAWQEIKCQHSMAGMPACLHTGSGPCCLRQDATPSLLQPQQRRSMKALPSARSPHRHMGLAQSAVTLPQCTDHAASKKEQSFNQHHNGNTAVASKRLWVLCDKTQKRYKMGQGLFCSCKTTNAQ